MNFLLHTSNLPKEIALNQPHWHSCTRSHVIGTKALLLPFIFLVLVGIKLGLGIQKLRYWKPHDMMVTMFSFYCLVKTTLRWLIDVSWPHWPFTIDFQINILYIVFFIISVYMVSLEFGLYLSLYSLAPANLFSFIKGFLCCCFSLEKIDDLMENTVLEQLISHDMEKSTRWVKLFQQF